MKLYMKRISEEKIFIDTSFFKALIDGDDDFHKKAVDIWEKLEKEKLILITSNYVLDETFTLIRARRGLAIVLEFRDYLWQSGSVFKIERVIAQDEAEAWFWFLKDWSKLSFTDCVSFALMKRLNLKRVLTFDRHFEKAGFVMVR